MSTLKELLKNVPVEWKKLGNENIGKFTRGSGLQKKDFTESGIGCIHYGQVYTFYNTHTYETKSFVSNEFAMNARKAKKGDLVIATTSENDEDVCKAVAWLGEKDIAISSDACFYSHKLNPKYMSYFFQTEQFQKQKRKYITGTKVRRVNVNDLEKILIPVPYPNDPEKSLAIQQEIVRVLDGLSEQNKALTAALTNEIDNRKKQYEYYREELFRFEGKEVEWKTLGKNITKTINIKWSDTKNEYKYIDLSSVDRERRLVTETTVINSENAPSRAKKIVMKDDVIFATTRPTQMRVCLITEEFSNQIASTGFCVLRAIKNNVLPKWILHQLTSNSFKIYLEENQAGIAYPAISDSKLKEFKIPIPFPNNKEKSIQEQERIIRLLDQFDEATKNIVAQLENEIDLRNKQYEYYRNELLTFND